MHTESERAAPGAPVVATWQVPDINVKNFAARSQGNASSVRFEALVNAVAGAQKPVYCVRKSSHHGILGARFCVSHNGAVGKRFGKHFVGDCVSSAYKYRYNSVIDLEQLAAQDYGDAEQGSKSKKRESALGMESTTIQD